MSGTLVTHRGRRDSPIMTRSLGPSGWREYGSTTLAGVPIDLRLRVGGYALTDAEVAARFATRAKVFAGYGGGAGWNPQP